MNKNVPKLRFKEFSDEWKVEELGNLLIKSTEVTKENTTIPVLTSSRKGLFLQNEYFNKEIAAKDTTGYNILRKGYFTYRHMSDDSVFYFNLNNIIEIGLVSPEYPVFTVKEDLNSYFLKEHLNSSFEFSKFCKMQKKGGTRTRLYFKVLETYKFNIPTIQEQERIANFFTVLDNLIEEQEAKVNDLELYKKGMMQQIFKQKIRFKDENGQDYLAWKEIKLKEILKERKLFSEKNKEYPHVTLSKEGIYEKGERYNRDFLVRTEDKKYKITLKNDICYNPANLKFGVICRNNYGKAIFSPIYITFEVLGCNNEFIEYFVCRTDFINRVRKYEEGTVYERTAVKPEDFLRFSVDLPCLEEQTKIANFLSNIDNLIEEEQKNLNDLKEMKKGLLQQMFV